MILAYPVKQHIIVAFETQVKKAVIEVKDFDGNILDNIEVENNDFVKIEIDSTIKKIKLKIIIDNKIVKKEIMLF